MNFIRLAMASYGKSSVENQYLILLEAPTCWLLNLHKRLKRLIISIESDGSTAKSSIRVTLFTCIREGSARRDDKTISKSEVVGWNFTIVHKERLSWRLLPFGSDATAFRVNRWFEKHSNPHRLNYSNSVFTIILQPVGATWKNTSRRSICWHWGFTSGLSASARVEMNFNLPSTFKVFFLESHGRLVATAGPNNCETPCST